MTPGLVRAGPLCLAGLLLAWTALALPAFWRSADAERIAAQIVGGRSFQPDVAAQALAGVERGAVAGICQPAALRAKAILQLYLYEDAASAQRQEADSALSALRDDLRAALRCIPTDAYLWLVLFSMESRGGIQPGQLDYLRLSYANAPNEGWVALKRNPIALGSFTALDAGLARLAVNEFAQIVRNGLYDEAAAIYAAIGPEARIALLVRLIDVPQFHRERLSRALDAVMPGVPIPGVDRSDDQPWKR
ncbi:conserved exported hypothetical protein [Bradyrhizobium sp. ORS 375]|uniref:hypothetical protein n=1 Tax=Bradyrhizobium sp. (strain ORS 375) TaxID=566679 RepID=UPI0002409653|nr:hypothetical protein [Bradyrhizobium sp. ORS 375]CCD92769.1 conserved exported hypothetical protein [Bradyrhizobium sp. ORS 375]